MLYDKHVGAPEKGTLLESVFVLIFLQRQEEQLLATRALVQATLSKEETKPAIEAFEMYCAHMFPFLAEAKLGNPDQREALKAFAKTVAKINLRSVYKQQADAYQARRERNRAPLPANLRTFRQPVEPPPNASVLNRPPRRPY